MVGFSSSSQVDEIAECIAMVDTQGTGEISLADFKAAFSNKPGDGEDAKVPTPPNTYGTKSINLPLRLGLFYDVHIGRSRWS